MILRAGSVWREIPQEEDDDDEGLEGEEEEEAGSFESLCQIPARVSQTSESIFLSSTSSSPPQ